MTEQRHARLKAFIRDWVEPIITALLLALVIRTFLLQPFKIPSGSMRMTLIEGDRLFVNKLAYGPKVPLTDWRIHGYTGPKRGDVIVFIFPGDRSKDFIKRLIAVGGETVAIKDGEVLINGQPVTDPPLKNVYYLNRGDYGAQGQTIEVPKGYVFVMGDNSGSSQDSRYWGFVPEKDIIGRADVVFWPLNRIRLIK